MGQVMTVLGTVAADALGITLPHEHVLLDLTCLWTPPRDPARAFLVEAPLCLSTRGLLACDPYHSRPNLRLDDPDLAAAELGYFKELGGQTVVDLSTRTIGPYPAELAVISRRTGLHIVMGTGFYVRTAHPDWVAEASVEALAEQMVRELQEGFTGTSVRAGIIGEIGTRSPVHPHEEKCLRAAARAQRATGAAINVHLAIFGQEGHRVLDILQQEGADLSRVALSHLDERPDTAYQRSLAERGVYLEFDCFGSECYWDQDGEREASDAERVEALLRLLDGGLERQILLSQDICTRMQLRHYGGMGYDHLLRTIVPRLRLRGVDEAVIRVMMVENPALLLGGDHDG
jgi:phosphotriesterase-related protein